MITASKNSSCDICTTNPTDIIISQTVKGRLLYCTCPFCQKKVGAEIYEGKITCPACNMTVDCSE